jgi:hypothetical protein
MEELIREVDPDLSLHYWDWSTDPRSTSGGRANLFTNLTGVQGKVPALVVDVVRVPAELDEISARVFALDVSLGGRHLSSFLECRSGWQTLCAGRDGCSGEFSRIVATPFRKPGRGDRICGVRVHDGSGVVRASAHRSGLRPASVTATSRSTAALDGRPLAAVRACRQ